MAADTTTRLCLETRPPVVMRPCGIALPHVQPELCRHRDEAGGDVSAARARITMAAAAAGKIAATRWHGQRPAVRPNGAGLRMRRPGGLAAPAEWSRLPDAARCATWQDGGPPPLAAGVRRCGTGIGAGADPPAPSRTGWPGPRAPRRAGPSAQARVRKVGRLTQLLVRPPLIGQSPQLAPPLVLYWALRFM